MLVADVGQHRDVVANAVHAAEREPVRRRLDDRGAIAGREHRGERALELGRLRRRGMGRAQLVDAADAAAHGRDDARRQARSVERRAEEARRRGLAVRAGDADHAQARRWIAEPPRGSNGERGRRAFDHDLRQVDIDGPLDNGSDRPLRPRLLDEIVAIDVLSRDGNEQEALPDRPRIVCEAGCHMPRIGGFHGDA